jgi:putative peptide zinc metalloprotease protein
VLRSAIPFRRPDPDVAKLKPWVRRVVTGWVLVIVPVLLLNLGYILVAMPRIVATGWDSAARFSGQLGTETGTAKWWAAAQLLLLIVPAVGITYTLVRTARGTCTSAWRWSAGSPPRRMSVMTGGLVLLSALAVAWWPDARMSPYRPGETGTVQQQVRELQTVGAGSPLLRTPQDAQQPLAPVPSGHSAVVDQTVEEPATAPAPQVASSSSPTPVPESTSSAAPSEEPQPESSPSSEPETSLEPSPSPSG